MLVANQLDAVKRLPPAARVQWLLNKSKERPVVAEKYRYDPAAYITHHFNWQPWSGNGTTGQQEIIDAYTLSIRQQHERYDYLSGKIKAAELEHWAPGETIRSIISVDAGHSVGKTKILSGLVNHFFDCFRPSIIYSYAPTREQIHDLLWKEIKSDRREKGLDGRILDLRLEIDDQHFAKGQATNNAHGAGTERAQGQHGDYLMFVIDEAEGVAEFVFDAIDSMTSGGIANIVLIARNPRTSSCTAHKIRKKPTVNPLRISCLNHPNVTSGRPIIPASVTRRWVDEKIDDWCKVVDGHNSDNYTFEVPWRNGIFEPSDQRFLWRVMGIVGGQTADDVFFPLGRFEAATERKRPVQALPTDTTHAQLGLDAARFGDDNSTGYCSHNGRVERYAEWVKQDSTIILKETKDKLRQLHKLGVTHVSIRIDGGGGYGSGIIDGLNADVALRRMFASFTVHEIHFNGVATDETAYADKITELYNDAAERTNGLAIIDAPERLEDDLTRRKFKWAVKSRLDVKVLEPKAAFKKRVGHSPDDGDGYVLAVASEKLMPPQERKWGILAHGRVKNKRG